jgi:cell division protein FtsI (penicillin-binding protein 3)
MDDIMTVRDALVHSCNVIYGKLGYDLGPRRLRGYMSEFGFGQKTGIELPGEEKGLLPPLQKWDKLKQSRAPIGQGVSVTPLQIARFYGSLTNDGVACTPHFLIEKPQTGEVPHYETKQIIQNTQAIDPLVKMLTGVVESGTGTGAQIPGYTVAGKTGTAEYVDEKHPEKGYVKDHYNVSFVGFLPNSDSKLVCFVGATEVPGEPATTEVFQDIMSYAIERYNINSTRG